MAEPIDPTRVAWLARRAGLGLRPSELPAEPVDPSDAIDALMAEPTTDAHDPWDGLALDPQDGGRAEAVRAWVLRILDSTTPYLDRRTLTLHGWIVNGVDKVPPGPMVDQIRLFMSAGGGSYPELLRRVTTDASMLVYLDGTTSTGTEPNENYARELLELFALGVGEAPDGSQQPYTEDDVLAASRALTGWVVRRDTAEVAFVPRRHDAAPQTLLGLSGVGDVDSVIDAVTAHPEHPRFVARRIASEYVGDATDPQLAEVVDDLVEVYDSADRRLDAVIDAGLRHALDGRNLPLVTPPVPWYAGIARALDLDGRRALAATRSWIRALGQVPLFPPNVAGWPTGAGWLTTDALIARTNVADLLVGASDPDGALQVAADDGDLDAIATLLGVPDGFGATTSAAIRSASSPTAGLTLALVSPEYLVS
ncbi:MAG: DUF1800 family protein [Actinomycetota bacterium]